jgi:molybdate transport system ATP-binding protein
LRLELRAHVRHAGGFVLDVDESCEAEALGVVGPSGSGKSTLLDTLAGFHRESRVVLDGADVSIRPPEDRGVGYVTQDALLFPHRSVRQNLLYGPRADALGEIPEALGIAHLLDRRPRHLSGGERRRVALARALLCRPRLLLLDEPFGGLDDLRRREAMSLLVHLRRTLNMPMVFVSHVAEEVVGLTDWTLRLDNGNVVARGPGAAILRAGETRIDNYFTAALAAAGRVRLGAFELFVDVPEAVTGDVRLACYAHDIIVARRRPEEISARNVFRTVVRSVAPAGHAMLVEFTDVPLRALVTPQSAASLALKPGAEVFAILKATSIAFLGRV